MALISPPEAHYTVYKLTNPEGKVYIGCTGKPVEERWGKGANYNKRTPIRQAIRKFGWDAFEKKILCEKLTKEGAEKLEKWFIAYYDSSDPEKGYNRMLGGLGKGQRMSEVSRQKCRESKEESYARDPEYRKRVSEGVLRAYENDPTFAKRVSEGVQRAYRNDPTYSERVSEGVLRAYENDPTLAKRVSEGVLRAYENDPTLAKRVSEGVLRAYENDPTLAQRVSKGVLRAYENDPTYTKRVSEGVLRAYENDPSYPQRLSESARKRYREEPERREQIQRRMREYLSRSENKAFPYSDTHPKPVRCVETGEVFPSQRAAERQTGYNGVHKACAGRRKTCGGCHWEYYTK